MIKTDKPRNDCNKAIIDSDYDKIKRSPNALKK